MSRPMTHRRLHLTFAAASLSLLAAGMNGCSSSSESPGTIPDPDGSAGEEGAACTADADCASGACGSSGRCVVGPVGPIIDGDFPDFLAGDLGPDDEGSSCVELEVDFERVPPVVMLLIDQSSSMETNFDAGKDRWETIVDTLSDPERSLLSRLQREVRFGMALYSSRNGDQNQCPLLEQVDIALDNFDAMRALLAESEPVDDTPTAESVAAVADLLEQFDAPGERFLILATDGEPDTCEDPDAQNVQGSARALAAREASIEAVTDAFARGITTRVISVGNEVGADHLKDLAVAGSGGDVDAEAFTALDTEALEAAFTAIIGGARSCDFQLEGTVREADAESGRVLLDGEPLPFGDPDGWAMPDRRTVRLQGAACDALQSASDAAISMSFPCGVYQVVPR